MSAPLILIVSLLLPPPFVTVTEKAEKMGLTVGNPLSHRHSPLSKMYIVKGNYVLISMITLVTAALLYSKLSVQAASTPLNKVV